MRWQAADNNNVGEWRKKVCALPGGCKTRHRFFPGDSIFDLEALGKYNEVIPYREWQSKEGQVDVMLVPGERGLSSGCLPSWPTHCSGVDEAEAKRPRKLGRWGKDVLVSKLACLSAGSTDSWRSKAAAEHIVLGEGTQESPYDEGVYSCSKKPAIKELLSKWESARTLGFDGFCSSTSILAVCEAQRKLPDIWKPVRAAFRFRRELLVDAAKRVRRSGLKGAKYLSVHWRHADIAVAGSYKRIGTYSAEVLVYHIKKVAEENAVLKELMPSLTAVYLATDNFFKGDIAEFKYRVKQALGLETIQFQSDDWVKDTIMDLIMCSKSDFFLSTYPGSFFSRFIEEERDLRKKPSNSHYSTRADVLIKREEALAKEAWGSEREGKGTGSGKATAAEL